MTHNAPQPPSPTLGELHDWLRLPSIPPRTRSQRKPNRLTADQERIDWAPIVAGQRTDWSGGTYRDDDGVPRAWGRAEPDGPRVVRIVYGA